jgi:hypothetical protein
LPLRSRAESCRAAGRARPPRPELEIRPGLPGQAQAGARAWAEARARLDRRVQAAAVRRVRAIASQAALAWKAAFAFSKCAAAACWAVRMASGFLICAGVARLQPARSRCRRPERRAIPAPTCSAKRALTTPVRTALKREPPARTTSGCWTSSAVPTALAATSRGPRLARVARSASHREVGFHSIRA